MSERWLLQNVRPWGRAAVNVLIEDGRIAQVGAGLAAPAGVPIHDGRGELLLPGLVNAHAHIDKNLLGHGWHANQVPGRRIRDYTDNERRVRREMKLNTAEQSAREVAAAVAAGVTHIRTHVDIDTEAGLAHFEGVMATREQFRDQVTMQLVAFPQSGMLIRPGTVELLEEAVQMGAEAMGGLDPSTVDRDPVKHLDIVFDIADRHGVELDIHLHEPGMLGAFSVELIAERTAALGMQGKVTISHAFCLGMVDDGYLDQLIQLLLDNQITIMSLGSGRSAFPPLQRLHEAGVPLCTGTDGVRDSWGPYNWVDILERVKLLGYRCGFRKDEEVEFLLNVATHGGARLMGEQGYGLEPGCQADIVVVPGDTPTQAVMEGPVRSLVVKRGVIVARDGQLNAAS
ncbi:MAG: amidohydrolase family protein [Anaerolineales bacterium]|nr:amidohydrolase family protein [Anaerolineales bacterium]